MTFYGVSGQPFVDLAPFLDLSGLDAVVEEVMPHLTLHCGQVVPFSPLQEVHPSDTTAVNLGKAIRLVSLKVPTTAANLERAEQAKVSLFAERVLPRTMAFLRKLPLKGIGRTSIYFSGAGESVPIHRDYAKHPGFNNQFIYLNPLGKPFFVLDGEGDRHVINTPAAIFNPSDFHGMDTHGEATFTIRVNGFFVDELTDEAGLRAHFSPNRTD
jgi:hypothetical protein